jgi:hypothetical protein
MSHFSHGKIDTASATFSDFDFAVPLAADPTLRHRTSREAGTAHGAARREKLVYIM